MSILLAIKDAWKNRDQLGDHNQSRELAQFLPAALEIQSAPQHPLARWLTWSIIALTILAIIWALLGKVNIVASAEGKIIPSSRVKKIQPLTKAMVKKILVRDGQYVEEGEPLIELDNTLTSSDQTRMLYEVSSLENNLLLSEHFLSFLESPKKETIDIDSATLRFSDNNKRHMQLLKEKWQEYVSKQKSLYSSFEKTQADYASVLAQVKKLEKILPIISQRAEKTEGLYKKQFVSEDEYLLVEQEHIEATQNLISEQERLKQLNAAMAEIKQQIATFQAATKAEALTESMDYQNQLAAMQQELLKAQDTNAKQTLYAPVSGTIQELAVNTVGGVVTEAQQLMLIVPDEEQLEVEVFLANKDIGFVNEGMMAEIKIHTFPFTKYGIVDSEVVTVSDDATVDEKLGLIYGMRLLMKKNTLNVNGKEVRLMPGMAVTAEVQTGYRRIIEFFLAPLMRAGQEGLRER